MWLEINASPERLDLSGALVRTAKAKGAKFTISTDAHHPKHLASMRYGVVTARRGWLGPDDIMNTLPADRFAAEAHNQIMKITSSKRSLRLQSLPVTEDEAVDQKTGFEIKRSVVRHARLGGDDGGRRQEAHSAGAAIPAARGENSCGNCPPATWMKARTPLQAARRELIEETGYRAKKWTKLASLFASPGMSGAHDHLPRRRT